MPISAKQLRRSQLRDACIYWLYIPAAVILGGKAADRLLTLPPLPPFGHWTAVLATVLVGLGVVLIQKATLDMKRYGAGTPTRRPPQSGW